MIKLIAFLITSCFLFSCSHKLYIVRHAEKDTTIKDNPPLTEAGKRRADALAAYLKRKKIHAIYSTNTTRTLNTAAPTAADKNLLVNTYHPDSVGVVLETIGYAKKNALIVGHSNTILPILTKMLITPDKKTVPDWEYDNLFVVKYKMRKGNYVGGSIKHKALSKYSIKKVLYLKYGEQSTQNDQRN